MSDAGPRAIPPPSSGVRVEQAREKAGYAAVEASVRATAERRVPVAPEAFARLAASMVPPPPPIWRRALARISRLWLLVAFVVVWELVSILWFGIGDVQIVYIIFLAAFFPVVLNSLAGARDVDSYLVRAGLSLGARPRELFLTVVLPAALPHIFTGMRVGLGIGWMALV